MCSDVALFMLMAQNIVYLTFNKHLKSCLSELPTGSEVSHFKLGSIAACVDITTNVTV